MHSFKNRTRQTPQVPLRAVPTQTKYICGNTSALPGISYRIFVQVIVVRSNVPCNAAMIAGKLYVEVYFAHAAYLSTLPRAKKTTLHPPWHTIDSTIHATHLVQNVLRHPSAHVEPIRDILLGLRSPLGQHNLRTSGKLPEGHFGDRCRRHLDTTKMPLELEKVGQMAISLETRFQPGTESESGLQLNFCEVRENTENIVPKSSRSPGIERARNGTHLSVTSNLLGRTSCCPTSPI